MFTDASIATNLLIFTVAGVVVWIAGTRITVHADVIAQRTGLGRAFVGLLLLATATSLPELATTITAGAIGNAELLVSNLLGGIVMQTAILAVMDLLLVRGAPLTFFAPNPRLLIDGVLLIVLLALAIVGISIDRSISFWGIGVLPVTIVAVFVWMLWTTHSKTAGPRWQATNPPPEPPVHSPDPGDPDADQLEGENVQQFEQQRYREISDARLYALFAVGALAILAGGYLLARTGDALAIQTGIGSTLVGAILVAVGTSLPEISTTAKAVRLGAYGMAITNIFGSNAFCVALFFVGDVAYRRGPILETASQSALFLAGLGIVVTCAYLWGLLERRDKTVLGMGIASAFVLAVYVLGMVVLYFIH